MLKVSNSRFSCTSRQCSVASPSGQSSHCVGGLRRIYTQLNGATMHNRCLDNAVVLHQAVLCSLPMPVLARLRPFNGKERNQASSRHTFNFSTENLEPREKLSLNPPEPSKMARVSFSLPVDVLPSATTCARIRRPNKHIHCRADQSLNAPLQDGNCLVGETMLSLSDPDHLTFTSTPGNS